MATIGQCSEYDTRVSSIGRISRSYRYDSGGGKILKSYVGLTMGGRQSG